MIEINSILLSSSCIVLGIFLGTQIAEACLFVPIWKKMKPDDFFEQHESVGPLIYRFFAPLTIAATVIPLATVVWNLIFNGNNAGMFCLLGISTLAFFSTYFLYFKEANLKFSERTISNAELSNELIKWGNWHWLRVVFEAIAFITSVIILLVE